MSDHELSHETREALGNLGGPANHLHHHRLRPMRGRHRPTAQRPIHVRHPPRPRRFLRTHDHEHLKQLWPNPATYALRARFQALLAGSKPACDVSRTYLSARSGADHPAITSAPTSRRAAGRPGGLIVL